VVVGVLDGRIQRDMRGADPHNGITTLVNELANLLDLLRQIEVRLCRYNIFDQSGRLG